MKSGYIYVFQELNSAGTDTVGSIAGFASIDWGAAIQVMTAITIGTDNAIQETEGRLLYEIFFYQLLQNSSITYLQWYICGHRHHSRHCMLFWNTTSCAIAKSLHCI